MPTSDQQRPEMQRLGDQSVPEVTRPSQSARDSSPKIRLAHPKGVFRFKTFEEMDAWDAIYKVSIRVK